MAQTFYFYDLETTGVDPRNSRIMQFAGQRTDMDLNRIGNPDNLLIKITGDILPSPDAILVTGITPQATLADGLTESEFLRYFHDQIATPNTIMVGFNSVRFDDEFIRFANYRNFFDAYEWQYADGRSRWDLLDLVRLTRALRPDGIKWPFNKDGAPTNTLETLTDLNGLEHSSAHDALSDVDASIAVAQLIKQKQPKLFEYHLGNRDKNKVAELVNSGMPFVYTTGRYQGEFEKTSVAVLLGPDLNNHGVLVYDLRYNPDDFTNLTPAQLADLQKYQPDFKNRKYFPVKLMRFNRCPAVAPLSVLDEASQKRLGLDLKLIETNFSKLKKASDFYDKILASVDIAKPKVAKDLFVDNNSVDGQLYDGFINDSDKRKMSVVRAAKANELADLNMDFSDDRLKYLLPLYKARNFPSSLNPDDREVWEKFKETKLFSGGEASQATKYFKRLDELMKNPKLNSHDKYLLEELRLYGESILPSP